MRIRSFVLLGLLALLIPAEAISQFPSGGSSGGSRGGFGDPSKLFDMMSGGRDFVTRDTLPNPLLAGMFDRFAQQMGVTDGKLTREQFNSYIQQKAAEKAAGGAPSGAGGGGPPPWAGGFKGGDGKGSDPNQGEMAERWAEGMFRRADGNGDGLLNYDEMSESLRTELDKWDANKDGFVDANEYKAYFKAVIEQRVSERGSGSPGMGGGTPETPIEDDEPKPVVYRAGKLPKELPAWFKTADGDADAQITMYEWRTSGKALDEFQRMDRNGDGFLTIAEVMYFTVGKNNLNGVALASTSADKSASGTTASETKSGSERPSFGSPSSDKGGFGRPSFGGSSDKGSSGRTSPWGSKGR
jgi:hypothetical protein